MDEANLLKILEGARARRAPWHEIASALDGLERGGALNDSARPWIRIAAELSGYTPNQLRRFQATARFVDRVSGEEWPRERIGQAGFSNLELIARIWAIDESRGRDVLSGAIEGKVNHKAMQRELQDLADFNKSPFSAGRNAANAFRNESFKTVQDELAKYNMYTHDAIWVKSGLRYPNPDYLLIENDERSQMIGIDIFNIRGVQQGDITKKHAVPETAKATFLDKLWVVTSGQESFELAASIDELGRNNVGQIILNEDLSKVLTLIEPVGPPSPDRTGLWIRYMSPWLRKAIQQRGWRVREV